MAHKVGPSLGLMGGGIKSVGLTDFDRFLDYLANEQAGTAEKSPTAIYRTVSWAYRCTQLRAWGVSAVPFNVYDRNSKPEDNPDPVVSDLLTKDLLWRSEAAICLWGVNYVLKAANVAGVVRKLQWLNPLTMTPNIETGALTGFTQKTDAGGRTREVKFTPEQMIYCPQFNPSNDLGPGISPMMVAMEAAGLAANANSWAARFFSHGAIPAVILSTDQPVGDDEVPRIRDAWEKLTSGVKNAWRTVILRNGLKPTIVGMPVKDLAMPELFQQVRAQIACAFEIPETMLTDSANFATAQEHRRSFWLETIIPHAEWHCERLNEQLFWPLGLEMRLHPEELEAVQKDEAEKSKSMRAMMDAAVLMFDAKLCDVKEARSILSEALDQMALPKLDPNWTPPAPVVPPALAPFTGQTPPPQEKPPQQPPPAGEEVAPGAAADFQVRQPRPTQPKASPEMLADMERWQRKCEKAGKARPFESENIPAGIKALVEARLAADTETAFSFLKQLDARRLADEKRLREAIIAWLAQQHKLITQAIFDGASPDWELFKADFLARMGKPLSDFYTAQVLRDAMTIGIDFDVAVINTAALQWAKAYGFELISGIMDTTRKLVAEAVSKFVATPGMTIGDLRDTLAAGFGEDRAQMIAVTETTRAYSAATDLHQTMLADAGLQFEQIWNTATDERVCELCNPVNGKAESEWDALGMDGPPPAHVNCRCSTSLHYVGRTADQAAAQVAVNG